MALITWLHLADLHCSKSNDYDISKVLLALWDDLKSWADNGLKPDFIVFTGDIAQSGKSEEYVLAEQLFFEPLLTTTELPKERLFIVPGNHDVEWDKVDRIAARGMAESLTNRDATNRFLSIEQDRTLYFSKFKSYANFINTYLADHLFFDTQHYCYGHTFKLNELTIGLLGLNSAWMSATNRDAGHKVADQGHLLIGERQLDTAFAQVSEADLCLALMHHPLDWLHESERTKIKRRLSSECHFVLHGHLHEPEVEIIRAISGKSVFIPTGALYDCRDFPNAYNLVQFETQTRRGTIYLRRYVDQGPRGGPAWIKDLGSTGDELDGQFPFDLFDDRIPLPAADLSNAKQVLYVEDDHGWRKLLETILYPPNFNLQFANSAAQARQLLTKDFDLLILNLCLDHDRDYEGVTLLNSLYKGKNPCKIPCIVLTGYTRSTRGLYDRYNVSEVYIKGDRNNFNKEAFSSAVNKAVGYE